MGIYDDGVSVVLRVDLSHYHAALATGTRGTTTPPVGKYAALSDRYVSVQFENPVTPVDVLWKHLRVDDPRVLEIEAEQEVLRDHRLRNDVKSAVKELGSRGGFRSLLVTFKDGTMEKTRVKMIADQIIEKVKSAGVKVAERRN